MMFFKARFKVMLLITMIVATLIVIGSVFAETKSDTIWVRYTFNNSSV